MVVLIGIMLYLFGLRRIAIWLIIGSLVNITVLWLLGILLLIDYLLS